MANRYGYQFLYSRNPMLTFIEGNFVVGASGAVGTVKGSGVESVTKLSTGTYQIKLEDGYPRYLIGGAGIVAPLTGSPVSDGSFVATTTYVITTVGDTDWAAIGLPSDLTPAIGQSFVATGVGGAGTGEATAVAASQVVAVQVVGNPNEMIQKGYINIQCVDDAGTVINPEATAVIGFYAFLRNSSLLGKGE